MQKELISILKETFGYDSFRHPQQAIIEHIMAGKDALVIMPTGGGKSICYQLPAIAMDGIAIVVSPLIALMKDQVNALESIGINAAAYNSHTRSEALAEIENDAYEGRIKLLYVSPEKLGTMHCISFLNRLKVSLVAIDEAHCVSMWGNDFRPDYLTLSKLKNAWPHVPFIALTASADASTQVDICHQLHMTHATTFISSFERKNITLHAETANKRLDAIEALIIKNKGQSGIIYCMSRKSTETVTESLNKRGIKAAYYHAGMSPESREKIQEAFVNDDIHIICATIAFGMGIDKSNIRWIVHYNMPKNIEGYYQEIGRAGRDGLPATALMFYNYMDYEMLKDFIKDSDADVDYKAVQFAKLERMWECANTTDCRTNLLLNYFGEFRQEPCYHCDNCLQPHDFFNGTLLAQKALSAMIRTNEGVSINMLIDILRGSNKKEILEKNYDKIKTYGIGRDLSAFEWKAYITQMINQGLMTIAYNDYYKLKTTPLSKTILSGESMVKLTSVKWQEHRKKEIIKTSKSSPSKAASTVSVTDQSLLGALKSWRLFKSRALSVPPYVIMTDNTLEGIASVQPSEILALGQISGIGQHRLEKYGKEIIALITEHKLKTS